MQTEYGISIAASISIGLTRKLKAKDVSLPVARAESHQFMGRGVGRDSARAIVWRTRGRPSSEIEDVVQMGRGD